MSRLLIVIVWILEVTVTRDGRCRVVSTAARGWSRYRSG